MVIVHFCVFFDEIFIWSFCLCKNLGYLSFYYRVLHILSCFYVQLYVCVCVYQKYYLQKFLFCVWHPVLLFAKLYFSIVYQRASALYNSKGPRSCFSKQRSSPHPKRHSVFLAGLLTPVVICVGMGKRVVLYIRGYLAASLVSRSQIPVVPSAFPVVTTKMSPEIAKCHLFRRWQQKSPPLRTAD